MTAALVALLDAPSQRFLLRSRELEPSLSVDGVAPRVTFSLSDTSRRYGSLRWDEAGAVRSAVPPPRLAIPVGAAFDERYMPGVGIAAVKRYMGWELWGGDRYWPARDFREFRPGSPWIQSTVVQISFIDRPSTKYTTSVDGRQNARNRRAMTPTSWGRRSHAGRFLVRTGPTIRAPRRNRSTSSRLRQRRRRRRRRFA